MFNLQGSEVIIILLLALVVLGPEKLPEAMRKAGRWYSDLRKMASGFQEEFRSAIDEPVREIQETANLLRDSADFTTLQAGERDEKPKSAEMGDASAGLAEADPNAVPTDDIPFRADSPSTPDEPRGSDAFGDLPEPARLSDARSDAQADGEPETQADTTSPSDAAEGD